MPTRRPAPTPRSWIKAIQTALGPGANHKQRRTAARQALGIAQALGWQDHRRAFAHYAMGRLSIATDTEAALGHFQTADRFYANSPHTTLHRAYVASQLAAHA